MNRNIDPVIIEYLKTRKAYTYAHLIRFERPIVASDSVNVIDKKYVYLTDASSDQYFMDPRTDGSEENLAVKYRANRVIEVPPITEYSTARATSISLRLDASAIGSYFADTGVITQSGNRYTMTFTTSIYNRGFVEGDNITIEIAGQLHSALVVSFPEENKIVVSNSSGIPTGSQSVFIDIASEELMAILQDKNNPNYASFVNREVIIYKVYYDDNNMQLGRPYYLYKGIIQDVSLEDSEGSSIIINWTLNSHWGDFSEVRGRITADEFHRALDESGVPQPDSTIKPIYAYDKGFIHSDTAVNLEALYNVQVEKQDVQYKKGFFGIGAKVKVKKYFEPEERQTELDFQLQSKALDVIYGVRPTDGNPIFADTSVTNSSDIFVAYSLCEGEISAVYDVIIQDKTLICNNLSDFDSRSQQNSENTVDLVCYGRADRGDVLEGINSSTSTTMDFYDTELLTYNNQQSLSYLTNYQGFSQPLNTYSGSIGIRHENSIKLSEPLNMTLSVYTGKSNQMAAPNLVQIAKSNGFKIQQDYWTGADKMEYWGPNHRLLDTAYVVAHFTIAENETTIPGLKFIVKGKFVDCYNYDYSYQHYDKASGENADNFGIGDYVNLYNPAGTLLDSNIRIINKFFIRNHNGDLEARFNFDREPNLDYDTLSIPTITKFYMRKSTFNWTMVTHNYVENSGLIAQAMEGTIQSITNVNNTVSYVVPTSSPITQIGSGVVGPRGEVYYAAMRSY